MDIRAGDRITAETLAPLTATEARYSAAAQTVTAFSLTNIAFETAVWTTALVTPDATGKLFTLNKAGLWYFNVNIRYPNGTASGAGNDLLRVVNSAKTETYGDDLWPVDEHYMHVITEYRVDAGTVVVVDTNRQATADPSVSGHFSLRWIKD